MAPDSNEETSPPPNVTGGGTLTPEQQRVSAWAEKATADPLAILRTIAQQWQTTVSAIVGLFGAATIITSDTVVASLVPPYKWWYVGAVVGSLGFAALAIWKASQAAQAEIGPIPHNLTEVSQIQEHRLNNGIKNLSCSRWLTLFAVIALATSTSVRWFGEKSSPPTRIEWVKPPLQ